MYFTVKEVKEIYQTTIPFIEKRIGKKIVDFTSYHFKKITNKQAFSLLKIKVLFECYFSGENYFLYETNEGFLYSFNDNYRTHNYLVKRGKNE